MSTAAVPVIEALEVVRFTAGGWSVGIEACQVRSSCPAQTSAVSGEIEAQLGLPPAPAQALQRLTLKRPKNDQDILVGGPVELIHLPVAAIHPLPPLLAARTTLHGLRALVLPPAATTVLLLFDVKN